MPNGKPVGSKSGALVPPGAVKAVVCTYFSPEGGDNPPLTEVTAVPESPERLIGYLNALPEPGAAGSGASPSTVNGERLADACSLMNASVYRIVFSYPDQHAVAINVLPTCATVERDGIVRQLERVTALRDYWRR